MPLDLLAGTGLEQLPMVDADISLCRQLDLGQAYNSLLRQLIDSIAWRQEQITVYGKSYLQPRLSAWHGELSYSYSGITMKPLPWTQTLMRIKECVEDLLAYEFNSVLLNLYRDHNDSMGMHSDNERELGERPMIASLSLGEERTFLLKHKTRKDLKTIKLPLPTGSLLLMKGSTQTHWNHGIAKEKRPCGPRVNLTFRRILQETRVRA